MGELRDHMCRYVVALLITEKVLKVREKSVNFTAKDVRSLTFSYDDCH